MKDFVRKLTVLLVITMSTSLGFANESSDEPVNIISLTQMQENLNMNRCMNGDPLCKGCQSCHRESCCYFAPYCDLWD